MFQAKFVMMSGISHTFIVLLPLMEPTCQLQFFHQNKYHILAKNEFLLKMLWLFVIVICVLHLFGQDVKVLLMIHVFLF
jgi:hypothetical protein